MGPRRTARFSEGPAGELGSERAQQERRARFKEGPAGELGSKRAQQES